MMPGINKRNNLPPANGLNYNSRSAGSTTNDPSRANKPPSGFGEIPKMPKMPKPSSLWSMAGSQSGSNSGTPETPKTPWIPEPNMFNQNQGRQEKPDTNKNKFAIKYQAPVEPIAPTKIADSKQSIPEINAAVIPEKEVQAGLPPAKTYETTSIGDQAMDKFSEYAMADEDPQVTAERDRLERNNLLRVEQSRRMAHENAVRAGFQPGSAQYEQMMRETVSSAENQGISSTNSFNDFMRSRRSDQQRELEGLAEGEFSRAGTQESRDWNEFNQLVKFLPTDKAQQMLAVSKATGVDITTAIGGMYDQSGNIKPEYTDMSQPELIKQGIEQSVELMTNNPDTEMPWVGNEKAAYIDKFYSDNFQNILAPSQTETEQGIEQKASKTRSQEAVDSGDYSLLTEADWNNMTDTQLVEAKSKGHFDKYDSSIQNGDNWSDLDNMNTSSATSYWRDHNPISAAENKGKIIEKDGVLYIITDPLKVVDLGGDNKRISVMAKPVKGGPEISIKDSSRFEGTTASFFDDLF